MKKKKSEPKTNELEKSAENADFQAENVRQALIGWAQTFEMIDIDMLTQDELFVIFDKHLAALQAELLDKVGVME